MVTKKASPAQLAARKKFAEMARTGAFKKRKSNPKTSNTALANWLDQIASGDTFSETKLKEALKHPAVTAEDKIVIKAALIGKPYSHTDLFDAAIHIRQYGKRATNPRKKTVSQKISQLTHEGYPQKQAIAVALSEQRAGKVKNNPFDQIMIDDILMVAVNDGDLYRRQGKPIIDNLAKKVAKGQFDTDKAIKLYGYLADSAVRDYSVQQLGKRTPTLTILSKPEREKLAEQLLYYYFEEIQYEAKDIAEKRKKNPTRQRATRRTAVMANPIKHKRTYEVYCQAPGQSIHSWTKLATFYNATAAKQYANAYAKMNKSHYVRVESHG